ncbi:Na+/H+ antiporter NhaC family protein [Clostridium perfringens]|uniref:Na+/H+ antiporter NhaC family protein n=1 Tax=Clostridium perfringens TaxID=1502 RepID=UPI000F8F2DE0|nr:Na+/H+ antiporter NhaC family protein [Clostridium perfringens]MBI5997314.1 Na+/H+ antiporter NhaC family protein [Clostridium perfringens]RUR38118.1 Na+/H+ antiporter NhaC family protein [Clostridium perfringens]
MKKGKFSALLPLIIFVSIYLGTSLVMKDFYSVSVLVPGIIAVLFGIFTNRKRGLEKNIEIFCKGAGNSNIILMCLIFILAGAFAEVAKNMGAVESTVNLGLTILPKNILVAGIFIISSFIAISLGTSMGTIAAIVPIAMGISDKTNIALPLIVGAVVGGAMFGDNLSMISDTTIAATKTQGCEMKDKFKVNFKVILPAAILVIVIYTFLGSGANTSVGQYDYNFIKIIPYLGILIAALMGANVIAILSGGIVLAGVIGFFTGSLDLKTFFTSISTGIGGMSELILISIIIGGIVEIIKENGGIDYVLNLVTKRINGKKGAEFGIGLLVSLVDACTANNTIAIVTVGPLAKDISDEYNLDSKRIAGILDMFSCAVQGIIPYGAQLMSAAALTGLSSFEIMKFLFYPYLMGISAIAFIAFFQKKESAEKTSELNAIAVE